MMIPVTATISHSPPPCFKSALPKLLPCRKLKQQQQQHTRRRGILICRAELHQDAPFAIAIGACMFNSLLFTGSAASDSMDDDDDGIGEAEAAISSTDARFTVMTIIGFIPYFNWLSWVFALMDTGKRRYAVYALVYLAPYIRTNLSLSPEESWLPIASIVLCIIHIQLEASIRSGDLDAFSFFNEAAQRLGLIARKKGDQSASSGKFQEKGRRQTHMNLPSGQQQSRDEVKKWKVPRKPSEDTEHINEDRDQNDERKH